MTQDQVNKIFETELGQQLSVIYVTSNDMPFIRIEEANRHAKDNNLEDLTITTFYYD